MTYKDALFFIADCLRLKVNESHKDTLLKKMVSKEVQWERVVQLASSHLVLPLLYIRFRDAQLLTQLPGDLQEYLKEIYQLNKTRNTVALKEIKALNEIFHKHGVQVIYLKGAAHLLKGMYEDIGERMIGDIDLLVEPSKMEFTANILMESGFTPLAKYQASLFTLTKHYPRLVHPSRDMAVEIHKDVIQNIRDRKLVFKDYDKEKIGLDNFFIPSTKHLIIHNILNTQINDLGWLLSSINLRQQYDLLLLSEEEKVEEVIESFGYFESIMKSYLIRTAVVFCDVPQLAYKNSFRSCVLVFLLLQRFNFPRLFKFSIRLRYIVYRMISDSKRLVSNMSQPLLRKEIVSHFTDANWVKNYFIKAFKKLKSF